MSHTRLEETVMDRSAGIAAFFGIVFGFLLLAGVLVFGVGIGAESTKVASLPVSPPLLFVPK
jgi:hypothetical protein